MFGARLNRDLSILPIRDRNFDAQTTSRAIFFMITWTKKQQLEIEQCQKLANIEASHTNKARSTRPNSTVSDSAMEKSSTDDPKVALDDLLVHENLAFSPPGPDGSRGGDYGWIEATARAPFVFLDDDKGRKGEVLLNVEFFGDPSWLKILLFVPGVCESAETWTVQNLARICASRQWRMAVLELEGHGLSGGAHGVIGRSWSRCVRQVTAFCRHALAIDVAQKRAGAKAASIPSSRFVLAGASLGGALTAYASQSILQDETFPQRDLFAGTLLLCPAVGVDPAVVPPSYVVTALSALSWMMPAVGIEGATPTEDPSHYSCPPWTQRNFEGAWPLATSKLLLDVTSKRVPGDVESGALNLLLRKATTAKALKHAIVVITGGKDPVVPIQAVRAFVDGMRAKADEEQRETSDLSTTTTIEIIEIKKGDHGLLAQSIEDPDIGKTQKMSTIQTIERVDSFLKQCEEMGAAIQ